MLPASLDNDTMDNKIITYSTLWNLVDIDIKDHKLKDIATLFLNAMNDWPTYDQTEIQEFIKELKAYFGSPLTIEKIDKKSLMDKMLGKSKQEVQLLNLSTLQQDFAINLTLIK